MSDEKGKGVIWAAVITTVGAIIAALIALHKPGDSSSGHNTTIDHNQFNGQANINSTVTNNGRMESEFDKTNGVAIEGIGGSYTIGSSPPKWNPYIKPTGQLYLHVGNRAHRPIDGVRLLVFAEDDTSAEHPLVTIEAAKLWPKQYASKIIRWTSTTQPPKRIRFCLTFASDTPGEFITLMVSAERSVPETDALKGDPMYRQVPFQYQLETPDVVFKSNQNGNCSAQGNTEKLDISDSHIYR